MLKSLTRRKQPLDIPDYQRDDLALHPIKEQDAQALFQIVHRDRDYLRKYQNWPDTIHTRKHMDDLIRLSLAKTRGRQGYDLTIYHQGVVAGKIGLVMIDWYKQVGEIGYWLGQNFQGKGLITRATWIVAGHAFTQLRLKRVKIRCAGGNVRSRAIPERLGFSLEKVIPNRLWIHNEQHDDAIYIMTTNEWYQQMIYHITTRAAWQATTEAYRADTLDTQGFIHASKREQIAKVANAVYAGQEDLVLLCIDPKRLTSPLKVEPPDPTIPAQHDNQETFPHIYGAINTDAVLKVVAFTPDKDGTFTLPKAIT